MFWPVHKTIIWPLLNMLFLPFIHRPLVYCRGAKVAVLDCCEKLGHLKSVGLQFGQDQWKGSEHSQSGFSQKRQSFWATWTKNRQKQMNLSCAATITFIYKYVELELSVDRIFISFILSSLFSPCFIYYFEMFHFYLAAVCGPACRYCAYHGVWITKLWHTELWKWVTGPLLSGNDRWRLLTKSLSSCSHCYSALGIM